MAKLDIPNAADEELVHGDGLTDLVHLKFPIVVLIELDDNGLRALQCLLEEFHSSHKPSIPFTREEKRREEKETYEERREEKHLKSSSFFLSGDAPSYHP